MGGGVATVRIVARRRNHKPTPWWAQLPAEELLDVRMCDLGLRIEGTALQARIERLYQELRRAGLRFRPYTWLSTDWFTPEGSSGFAIPFYLAHGRLVRLEHAQMLEAEGSTHDWCMRLLRHEAGHALDNAFRLHRRADWRATFGRYSEPYRADYLAKPYSRDYVHHLGFWYAQSHPAEDYAESFAVWLAPGSRWRQAYAGWPALHKLERLDDLLHDLEGQRQLVSSRDRPESLPQLRYTLRDYYRRKKASYGRPQQWNHDEQLLRLFGQTTVGQTTVGQATGGQRSERAATFLRNLGNELRARVSTLTGHSRYVVDQALATVIVRCRELDLWCVRPRSETRLLAAVLLTMITLNLSRGRASRFRR